MPVSHLFNVSLFFLFTFFFFIFIISRHLLFLTSSGPLSAMNSVATQPNQSNIKRIALAALTGPVIEGDNNTPSGSFSLVRGNNMANYCVIGTLYGNNFGYGNVIGFHLGDNFGCGNQTMFHHGEEKVRYGNSTGCVLDDKMAKAVSNETIDPSSLVYSPSSTTAPTLPLTPSKSPASATAPQAKPSPAKPLSIQRPEITVEQHINPVLGNKTTTITSTTIDKATTINITTSTTAAPAIPKPKERVTLITQQISDAALLAACSAAARATPSVVKPKTSPVTSSTKPSKSDTPRPRTIQFADPVAVVFTPTPSSDVHLPRTVTKTTSPSSVLPVTEEATIITTKNPMSSLDELCAVSALNSIAANMTTSSPPASTAKPAIKTPSPPTVKPLVATATTTTPPTPKPTNRSAASEIELVKGLSCEREFQRGDTPPWHGTPVPSSSSSTDTGLDNDDDDCEDSDSSTTILPPTSSKRKAKKVAESSLRKKKKVCLTEELGYETDNGSSSDDDSFSESSQAPRALTTQSKPKRGKRIHPDVLYIMQEWFFSNVHNLTISAEDFKGLQDKCIDTGAPLLNISEMRTWVKNHKSKTMITKLTPEQIASGQFFFNPHSLRCNEFNILEKNYPSRKFDSLQLLEIYKDSNLNDGFLKKMYGFFDVLHLSFFSIKKLQQKNEVFFKKNLFI